MTTPNDFLASFVLLPDLELEYCHLRRCVMRARVTASSAPCPQCSGTDQSIYDHRTVTLKDVPLGLGRAPVQLSVRKRRFFCRPCRKPFTERIPGVLPGRRTTERFREAVMLACERYVSLKQVQSDFKISSDFVYRAFYERLELKRRKDNQYPWPSAIGIDEHGFGRFTGQRRKAFVSMVVDQSKGKLMEVVFGKSQFEMEVRLAHIEGRENVRYATIDMCDPYKNFIKSFFPNAEIIADKFHVLRLPSGPIMKERKLITGTNADRRARGYLLMNADNLEYGERHALYKYLDRHPKLKELHFWKECLHRLYRTRGHARATAAFDHLTESMARSQLPEIQRLRKTLLKWKTEILNYFKTRMTNARLEGFNCKASLVRRRAYGYRNPNNYRLRLLSACS